MSGILRAEENSEKAQILVGSWHPGCAGRLFRDGSGGGVGGELLFVKKLSLVELVNV